MTNDIVIYKALRLPAPDIEALLEGRLVAAISNKFINREKFALCSTDTLMNPLPVERYYHSNFLHVAQTTLSQLATESFPIKAWAKCEWCHDVNPESIATLSQLSIWTKEALEETLTLRKTIFLAYLRVYHLSEPIEVLVKGNNQFIPLRKNLTVSDINPVLTDNIFITRKQRLEKLEPPKHPELESLLDTLSPLALSDLATQKLKEDIQVFLGWNTQQINRQVNSNLDWINQITALGNRSKEKVRGKSNYQAGTDFENIVRQSLEFLGFTVDHFHKGGAGGVDVFCSHPYPLIGECKAGKKIPNDTAVQLLNLGTLRLKSQAKQATQLIIGPGKPTKQLEDAAKVHGMAIINPETLEKLVKLQSKYRNSIDLFKLQDFLKAGQSDTQVEKYIVQVEEEIKLRSHIIRTIKELSDQNTESPSAKQKGFTVTEIRTHYNVTHNPKLLNELVHNLLIELSSPLTGYLGRIKGTDWKSDKFYFLRDLSAYLT